MSLDVYLLGEPLAREAVGSGIFVRENGQTKEISRAEWDEKFLGREPVVASTGSDDRKIFSRNITHNLGKMAAEAGIYEALWRPEEIGIERAAALVAPLDAGLVLLKNEPDRFKAFNPSNGWGSYEGLVRFVSEYLDACRDNPSAIVHVSR